MRCPATLLCRRSPPSRRRRRRPPSAFIAGGRPGVFAAISIPPAFRRACGGLGRRPRRRYVCDAGSAHRLIVEIRRTPLPIRFAALTHLHSDHMGGSEAFAREGAAVLAHENVRAWAHREFQEGLTPGQRARYAALRRPDVTYRDRVSLWLGNRRVEIFHLPGHSGSDSVVLVPDAKVLFTGDLLSRRWLPYLGLARTDRWIETLDTLLKDYPDATLVPGHGGTGRALDVRSFRDYLNGLRLAVARALHDGKSGAALVEAVKPQLSARYRSWDGFEEGVDGNIADVERELTGTKVYPPAPGP
jgi:glyoxylase-like metal-dependent hydrolase (beta-lactamase superfamily II)